ncbi:unnamed protein product [Auanema sp. JU1783]|nr:unnamed protein product [Auanema sp. JU1783]
MSVNPFYDPYNDVSYLELNKRKRGQYQRHESERIENRTPKPVVKKFFIKKNGESFRKKPKLFVWREWKSPGMQNLLSELTTFLGTMEITSIFDSNGYRISRTEDLKELATYYVTGDESLLIPDSDYEDESPNHIKSTSTDKNRHTSLSAPEFYAQSRSTLYEPVSYPPTPPPQPSYPLFSSQENLYAYTPTWNNQVSFRNFDSNSKKKRISNNSFAKDLKEFESVYQLAMRKTSQKTQQQTKRKQRKDVAVHRSRSAHEEPVEAFSDFDHHHWQEKDRQNLHKHKEKLANRIRSNSAVIYNRRDQTHPEAYIIYVFMNGQGMECQYINFQRNQLAKGMHYVLELVARKYQVNPLKLCNMDGKKINDVSELMTRGAYVLIPAGQTFRDTWYFLPDNAIDTSTSLHKIEERSEQRDRLIQKREKKIQNKTRGSSKSQQLNPNVGRIDAHRDLYLRRY